MRIAFFAASAIALVSNAVQLEESEYTREDIVEAANQLQGMLGLFQDQDQDGVAAKNQSNQALDEVQELDEQAAAPAVASEAAEK